MNDQCDRNNYIPDRGTNQPNDHDDLRVDTSHSQCFVLLPNDDYMCLTWNFWNCVNSGTNPMAILVAIEQKKPAMAQNTMMSVGMFFLVSFLTLHAKKS